MDEQLASTIGGRIRAARVANHQTQAVVAGLSGITTDYLYQLERGKKLPTIPVLAQLAETLRVPLANLLGQQTSTIDRARPSRYGDVLYRALTQPTATCDQPPVAELRRHVEAAWRTWQTSPHRYSQITTELPVLITDLTLAERQYRAETDHAQRRAVHQCAVDLYGLLRTVAKRVNRLDLALLVADRAIRAAEVADDPLRLAAARWNLAHVLLAEHQAEGAEVVVMHAADAIRRLVNDGDLDATALYGSLVLLGAVASVRQGDV
jgi:transcriptional regulator with XRE-family HTH domain